ncbi:MAG: DUF3303 family protein [Gemmatimonadota bacterium]|jgi:hypothetical protein
MRFLVLYTMKPEARAEAVEKFMATGGLPPEGVTMLGRWHDVSGLRGFTLCEADSVVPAARWCREWAEHLEQEVIPVMTDEEAAEVLGG